MQKTPAFGAEAQTPGATPRTQRLWDATPAHVPSTPSLETPAHEKSTRRNRWDETPRTERETPGHNSGWMETPKADRGAEERIIEAATASKR